MYNFQNNVTITVEYAHSESKYLLSAARPYQYYNPYLNEIISTLCKPTMGL